MSFINATILQSFVSDNSFLTKAPTPAGLDEAIKQADEIIYQKTKITPPSDPAQANAKLRNIACALVVWFTTGMQGKLDEFELSRRKKMYDDAMAQLHAIQNGDDPLLDSTGTILSSQPATYFQSTQRMTEVP
ncbi:MAG: hypothetical protein AB1728_13300 [Bacteroidota bacterium]